MQFTADASIVCAAARCLVEPDPARKAEMTRQAAERWSAGHLRAPAPPDWRPLDEPGRDARPVLVHPRDLPRRGLNDAAGRAALIHAVAHIELNAINLAWDAVQRFPDMPTAFHGDWIGVAAEEAYHFGLMAERLETLGYRYGDFAAHDGLWAMARRTAGDVLDRMALVPRVMEARGLDVTPGMIERFRAAGDDDTAERLGIILRDEVGHVAIGSRWFRHLCRQRGLEPDQTYLALLDRYLDGQVRCPLNRADRLRAGFDAAELDALEARCRSR
jgi:uncharacterized ferritin-like protein (DUF455 family)